MGAVKRGKNGVQPERDSKGRFVAGNKAGGRKAIPQEVREMLQAATPAAVQLLVDTIDDKEARLDLRVRCAELVLDRVYGKATQPIEGDLSGGVIITLDTELSRYAD